MARGGPAVRVALDPDPAMSGAARRLLGNFSVEVTAGGADALPGASALLPCETPISITFLPGEKPDARVAAAALIRRLGFVPIPHISARRLASCEDLDSYLAALSREAGLDRALVVAGDCSPMGPFRDALDVIRTGRLAEHGVRRVGISGYPDGHLDIPADRLWHAMSDKYRSLLDMGHEPIITTQFGFDAAPMIDWIEAVRDRGIMATIRLGVPGPASAKSLLRFAARCGVGASAKVLRKYGISISRLMNVVGPDRLIEGLADGLAPSRHGDVRIHIYPFGGLERTAQWAASRAGPYRSTR